MTDNQFKSLFFTFLIFGGAYWFLFGAPDFKALIPDSFHKASYAKTSYKSVKSSSKSRKDKRIGKVIDSYKGVKVYHNGSVKNVSGRNVTADGYNLGLKYQCVEFVKRFYYEAYGHKMPNSYGHAKDFWKAGLKDGGFNKDRHMWQYTNGSRTKPKANDLIVIGPTWYNSFGHVAIVTQVTDRSVHIIQQNPGVMGSSRARFKLTKRKGLWYISDKNLKGWLRL